MNQSVKLQSARLPKLLGELSHSNQFLKISILLSYGVSIGLLGISIFFANRSPVVMAFTPKGVSYDQVNPPKAEDEIAQAVRSYVEYRYNWEPKTVSRNLHQAEAFILPQSKKAFESAIANVVKFSSEKGILQKIYVNKLVIDLEAKTAQAQGDRITAIQNLKAVTDLKLELVFEAGPRTEENPWGIYFSREREQ